MSRFAKNILVGSGGVALASAISIGLLPFVARLYGPEQMGVWQLVLTAAMLFLPLATLRLEGAIVLEQDEGTVREIIALISWLTLIVMAAVSLSLYLFKSVIVTHYKLEDTFPLWFVPLTIAFLSLFQMGHGILVRIEKFSFLAMIKIASAFVVPVIAISMAIVDSPNTRYYIVASCCTYLFQSAFYVIHQKSYFSLTHLRISLSRCRSLLRKYQAYPRYMVPYAFVINLLTQFIAGMLAFMYSPAVVGAYFVTQQIVRMPVSVLATGIRNVLFSYSAKQIHENRVKVVETIRFLSLSAAIVVIPLACLTFRFIDELVVFFLGDKWQLAGAFAPWILLPSTALVLVSWLDRVYEVFGLQRLNVWLHTTSVLMVMGLFYLAYLDSYDPLKTIRLLSVLLTVFYMVTLFALLFRIGAGQKFILMYLLVAFVLTLMFGLLSKQLELYLSVNNIAMLLVGVAALVAYYVAVTLRLYACKGKLA